jgi:hypothetical protein
VYLIERIIQIDITHAGLHVWRFRASLSTKEQENNKKYFWLQWNGIKTPSVALGMLRRIH